MQSRRRGREPSSPSPCRLQVTKAREPPMKTRTMLLVEDNQQDELLTLRALRKVNLANHVDVVRDGQQAMDFLFGEGEFVGRPAAEPPAVVLLDINLPRLSGLEVLN